MTDKQHDTRQDTQKAAGELQGAHTQQTDTRNKPRGRGDGRGHNRIQQNTAGHTRQPRNTQQEQASGGQAEGRQTGREERGARMASRLGSDGDKRSTAAGREQGETERKKSM